MIRIIYKQPNRPAKTMLVPYTLTTFQQLVGGRIEAKPLFRNVVLIVHEEGKIRNLPQNFRYGFDVICGPAIFVSADGENMNDLTDEQMQIVRDLIQEGEL